MKRFILAATVLAVAACASGSSGGWSASTWNGLAPQNVYGGGYQFYAAPAEGQGFKLKFTVKTDGNFGIASGGAPTDEELAEAAKAAAPEGCVVASVERTPDGGALADYDCGESDAMISKVSTYLMFTGEAAEALALYTEVFPESESSLREGPVYMADWRLAGHDVMLVDSPPVHDFTFTPSTSLFVDFDDAAAMDAAFTKLSEGGRVMMPLDNYGFSQRFGWIEDRFGVSWQLNLA